ncbi:MAG: panthothenate synthetase [Acidobacteriota bacterium]
MRMLLEVYIPNHEFNEAIKDGTAGKKMKHILEDTRPEAVYFCERDGKRGATMIVNVPDPSKIPALAEPWFLMFNAEVKFRICMTVEDLQKAGLEDLGKKWS